jgi:hypothetical protein
MFVRVYRQRLGACDLRTLCADVPFYRMASDVNVSPSLMANWIGRGGPAFGTLTCTHNSSPARRKEGSLVTNLRRQQ